MPLTADIDEAETSSRVFSEEASLVGRPASSVLCKPLESCEQFLFGRSPPVLIGRAEQRAGFTKSSAYRGSHVLLDAQQGTRLTRQVEALEDLLDKFAELRG